MSSGGASASSKSYSRGAFQTIELTSALTYRLASWHVLEQLPALAVNAINQVKDHGKLIHLKAVRGLEAQMRSAWGRGSAMESCPNRSTKLCGGLCAGEEVVVSVTD
jgi:hypothetical protein